MLVVVGCSTSRVDLKYSLIGHELFKELGRTEVVVTWPSDARVARRPETSHGFGIYFTWQAFTYKLVQEVTQHSDGVQRCAYAVLRGEYE